MERRIAICCIATVTLFVTGCDTLRSWVPDVARTQGRSELGRQRQGLSTVIVAPFSNPRHASVGWKDLGNGVSETLSRSLVRETPFDVWMDPAAARKLESSVRSTRRRGTSEIDFLVTGKVTDFHHTDDLPEGVQKRRQSEAVVAIDFRIIEVASGRVIATDHVRGSSKVREARSSEIYGDVEFGSYVFWGTPLGRASAQAVERAATRIADLLPSSIDDPKIVGVVGRREAKIDLGTNAGLRAGDEYYVCVRREPDARVVAIRDETLGRALMLRVTNVRPSSSIGWLLGRPPLDADLRGAVLRREPPPDATVSGAERVASK